MPQQSPAGLPDEPIVTPVPNRIKVPENTILCSRALCHGIMLSMNHRRLYNLYPVIAVMLFVLPAAGCSRAGTTGVIPRLEFVPVLDDDGDELPGGAVLPEFVNEGGEPDEAMVKLNGEIDSIREDYAEAVLDPAKDAQLHVESQRSDSSLGTTIYLKTTQQTLSGKEKVVRDLASFGYDCETREAVLAPDALERTGMNGVELSTKMEDAVRSGRIRGNLLSTEMEGFLLNGKNVELLYMKLLLVQDNREPEDAFFSYNPETGEITDIPFDEMLAQ